MRDGVFIFCAALGALGGLLMGWHALQWKRHRERPDLSEEDQKYFRVQFRRRMQVSAMMALSGVAVFVGAHPALFLQTPVLFVVWLGATVLLVLWMALLAVADVMAIRHYARRRLDRLARQEHVLLAQMRASRRDRAAKPNGEERKGQNA